MSAPGNTHAVNQHYLSKVMDLAELMSVEVIVDVFDVRGMKLVAKGAQVTRALQERLIVHKLKAPLESSIRVPGGVDPQAIVTAASRILDASAPLARILRATGVASVLPILSGLEFGNAMSMMLTISHRAEAQALEHAVLVSMLSICMARKLRLSETEQRVAGLAGLLHDIGELYVDPAYLVRGKRLQPHEWAHVVVHPRIGEMLINELAAYPAAVGRAVGEHHERYDGTGYPRQTAGSDISAAGQAVSVAELIAGLLLKDRPLERAELALKIIPGEHAPDLLSAISGALRLVSAEAGAADPAAAGPDGETVERLFWRISAILETGRGLLDGPAVKSPRTRQLLAGALDRVKHVQRAFIGTGLDAYLGSRGDLGGGADGRLLFEKETATREIQWRLRDIARDLALRCTAPDERPIFAALIKLLDDEQAAAVTQRGNGAAPAYACPPPVSQPSVRRMGA